MIVQIRGLTGSPGPANGQVVEIAPAAEAASHVVQFRVDLPPGSNPLTGAFVRVAIPLGDAPRLLIPREAVRLAGQLSAVFVVEAGGIARMRLVKLAPHDESRYEVLSGLEPGERYVTPLKGEVTDGSPVEKRS